MKLSFKFAMLLVLIVLFQQNQEFHSVFLVNVDLQFLFDKVKLVFPRYNPDVHFKEVS